MHVKRKTYTSSIADPIQNSRYMSILILTLVIDYVQSTKWAAVSVTGEVLSNALDNLIQYAWPDEIWTNVEAYVNQQSSTIGHIPEIIIMIIIIVIIIINNNTNSGEDKVTMALSCNIMNVANSPVGWVDWLMILQPTWKFTWVLLDHKLQQRWLHHPVIPLCVNLHHSQAEQKTDW